MSVTFGDVIAALMVLAFVVGCFICKPKSSIAIDKSKTRAKE